jgi:FKBP-type peptidyl-prolyl cis-trans isomerase FkpA
MKKLFFIASLLVAFVSCKGNGEEGEKIEFKSPKEELSYIVGAEHAKIITQSGDPNLSQLDFNAISEGFDKGLDKPEKISQECLDILQKLFGPDNRDFNQVYLKDGCNCIGSSVANTFVEQWSKFNTIDQLDLEMVKVGFKHGINHKDTIIEEQVRREKYQKFVQGHLGKIEDDNRKIGADLIAKAKSLPNAKVLENGSVLVVLEEGKGGNPSVDSDVKADYILTNGKGDTVQSSFDIKKMGREIPPFNLSLVVQGWKDAFPNMRKGGKYRLYLPGELAYGKESQYEPLVFYIEFHDFAPAFTWAERPQNMMMQQ